MSVIGEKFGCIEGMTGFDPWNREQADGRFRSGG